MSEGKALEELVSEAILKYLNIPDSEIRVEPHLKLCEKYISEAEEFLAKRITFELQRKLGMQPRRQLRRWRLRG